jgi:glycosyltransferase involved in cell wall biosynthesis
MSHSIAFVGGARYSLPLDATSAKKFRVLAAALGEVFVVGFSQDMTPRRVTEHAHFYLLPQWPSPVLRYATMFTIGPAIALWLIFRRGARVLIAQSPHEGFAAALAKRAAGWFGRRVALVVESHGDFEVSLFLQRRIRVPNLYRWLMRLAARFALRHADVLRPISRATREQLHRWAPDRPLVQFPTWTDIGVFLEAGACPSARRSPLIVYAGVLTPLKGVHHLLQAFACLRPDFPDAELAIIGRDENLHYARGLRVEVERLGLDGRVRFVGEVPQADLAEWMAQGQVFVIPSLSEGLGRVVIEAMAAGTPVIGSHVGGIPEMVQDGITGFLVPPGDEEALAEKLRWVLSYPEQASAMARRARIFAQQFFSTEAYLQGYREVLELARKVVQGQDGAAVTIQSGD